MISFLIFTTTVCSAAALLYRVGVWAMSLPEIDDGVLPPCWAPE